MTPDVDAIMRFEEGGMAEEEVPAFLQSLIDTGMAWKLQGFYGRAATLCIESGECHR